MHEQHDADLANARAAEEKLQDAAHGGPPVAIPGSTDSVNPSTPPQVHIPPIPSTEDDRAEDILDGGGRL